MIEADWQDDVIAFWFDHVGRDRWFAPDHGLDEEIGERFEPLWGALKGEAAARFAVAPRRALAAVLLFDQFPRNMFRHEATAFETDPLALAIAERAIDSGYDRALDEDGRQFLYMPFMHSELLADQDRSVALFETLEDGKPLGFALQHRDLIRRFGRFPHRNEALGRLSGPEEIEAIAIGGDW